MQDRMTIAPTHRVLPLLAAVEPITAPAADPIDHADPADTQALAVEIAWFQRSLDAPSLLSRALTKFGALTDLFGHLDGGTVTYTEPNGRSVTVAISPFAARKLAKALHGVEKGADAWAGLKTPEPGASRPQRLTLAPAPVQS